MSISIMEEKITIIIKLRSYIMWSRTASTYVDLIVLVYSKYISKRCSYSTEYNYGVGLQSLDVPNRLSLSPSCYKFPLYGCQLYKMIPQFPVTISYILPSGSTNSYNDRSWWSTSSTCPQPRSMEFKPKPIMLLNLPIILSRISQKCYLLFSKSIL